MGGGGTGVDSACLKMEEKVYLKGIIRQRPPPPPRAPPAGVGLGLGTPPLFLGREFQKNRN